MKIPLVSILIPAYNAEPWIAETLQSAIAQSWPNKEIIVVDDGSRDRTFDIARHFETAGVRAISTKNQGAAAARNCAFNLCRGDYIQWLDADDLLSSTKIASQMLALRKFDDARLLASGPWAHFRYQTGRARFISTSLCQDLSPVEWLLRKMGENLHMQPATWLVSRHLTNAAGPWDTRLRFDDDGEYFCRVLLASQGTRFVPEARVFYRLTNSNSVSFIGSSEAKKNALLISIGLHIRYLRSLEESDRVHRACVTYIQKWLDYFYPEQPDVVEQLREIAADMGGKLETPRLRWKYNWMVPVIGFRSAKQAQIFLPQIRNRVSSYLERLFYSVHSVSMRNNLGGKNCEHYFEKTN